MKRSTYWIIIICLVFGVYLVSNLTPETEKKTIAEIYNGIWQSTSQPAFAKIAKTIIQNNMTGCGEFYFKESIENNNEYLLACNFDGREWKYYIIWPEINEVMPLNNPITNAKNELETITPPY